MQVHRRLILTIPHIYVTSDSHGPHKSQGTSQLPGEMLSSWTEHSRRPKSPLFIDHRNSVDFAPPSPLNFNRLQKDPILHVQQPLLRLASCGPHDRPRRRHLLHDIPKRRRGIQRVAHRRKATQHRRAEHHRRGVRTRQHDGHVARVRQQAHERRVLCLRPGEVQRADGVSGVVQLVDDVPCLKCDRLEGERVFAGEVVQRRVLDRTCVRIRARGREGPALTRRELTRVSPIIDPRIRGSAMGDRLPSENMSVNEIRLWRGN